LVNHDEIVSTGYNGAPRGRENCTDLNFCIREKIGVPRGERTELCRSVHSEMNACISAAREKMIGGTLYLAGIEYNSKDYVKDACCCSMCKRIVINAGIKSVVIRDDKEHYRVIPVDDWIANDESIAGTFGY
jgi:dCMP deaminase